MASCPSIGVKSSMEEPDYLQDRFLFGFLSGILRENWKDTDKISMAPAQG